MPGATRGDGPPPRASTEPLPGRLQDAAATLRAAGLAGRADLHPVGLLAPDASLPSGYDAVWMSQFLCCFPREDVVRLLRLAASALDDGGRLFVLDISWERQENEVAAYCPIQTSLYFACLANGNSRMLRPDAMLACIRAAGLRVEEEVDDLGTGHTLFSCRRAADTSPLVEEEARP
ncbi:MAG: hypothetical protein D6731_08740 [Planctomycetota bacterium]|nr:MAG: hypothetical protein D6731_08740 [Planctomycetota bacterium]